VEQNPRGPRAEPVEAPDTRPVERRTSRIAPESVRGPVELAYPSFTAVPLAVTISIDPFWPTTS